MDLTLTLILCLIIIFCSYIYVKRAYSYWEDKGIPYLKPSIPYGNLNGYKPDRQFGVLLKDFYDQLKGKGPLGGLYFFWRPVIMLVDPKLIKRILITDFNYFEERPVFRNESDDPLSANLFFLNPDKWRALRKKLSPTFTSGKMKFMFPTITKVAENLVVHIDGLIDSKENDIFIQDSIGKFTTDVIGSCAFGIECNSLGNKNEDFRRMGQKSFSDRKVPLQIFVIMQAYSNILRFFKATVFPKDVGEFFSHLTRDTVKYREANNIERNDFLDILIKLKNNPDDSITLPEIIGQTFIFFVAGFETSATTMTYALYELSKNQDIQEKCREEIRSVLAKYNGEFTYEAMMDMNYLDNVISETLRLHTPVGQILRKVTKPYRVPDTNLVLPIGTEMLIAVYGVHLDSDIYPEPKKFIPERFAKHDENRLWLPFGDGPRNCIGLRFGLMQARVGLVTLLTNYRFSHCDKTQSTIDFDINNVIMTPKTGIWLKATKL